MATHVIDINALCIERPDGKLDCSSRLEEKTKFNWKPVVFAILMVMVIILLNSMNNKIPSSQTDSFGNRGQWKLFYSPTCPHCVTQLKVLDSLGLTNSVNKATCAESPAECSKYGITGVPAWVNLSTGEKKIGSQDAQTVKKMV